MAEAKKPSHKAFLESFGSGARERLAEIDELIAAKRSELEELEAERKKFQMIVEVSEGKMPMGHEATARKAAGGGRAPRSEGLALREKIAKLLEKGSQPVAEIISKVAPDEGQRVRNSLALLVKNKKLVNKGGEYSLR